MIKSFITAIKTLTRFPIKGKETTDFASSLTWFPVVGFILATILSGIIHTVRYFSKEPWNEATALLIILLSVLFTGALHLDGFADWADSLGALHNKEKMLTIMKDSNSGAFGIIAIVLLLISKWIVLVKLLELHLAITGLFISYVTSRFAMVYLAVTLPYARTGNGTAKQFIQNANNKHLISSLLISLVLLFAIGNIPAIIFFSIGFIVTLMWKLWCKKNLNGITGDLLGAGSELVEVFSLYFLILFHDIFFF